MRKPTISEIIVGLLCAIFGFIVGIMIVQHQISGDVLLGIVGIVATLSSSILGYLGASIIYERQKKDKECEARNDLLSKIRLLLQNEVLREFNCQSCAIEATDELVNKLKGIEKEMIKILHGYYNYSENEGIFEHLLAVFTEFIYQVECHRGGQFDCKCEAGNCIAEEIVLDSYIMRSLSSNDDLPEAIVVFDKFVKAINQISKNIK